MKKTPFSLTILPFGLHLFTIDIGAQMQSANYRITTTVVSGGGGPMASASFQANGTIDQSTPSWKTGWIFSDNFGLCPGFLCTRGAGFDGFRWDI